MRQYVIGLLYSVAGSFAVGVTIGFEVGHRDATGDAITKIHNAAATGAEITVDGTSYSVYRTPEHKQLQAMRSEYARRCQAITDKFFNEEFKQ